MLRSNGTRVPAQWAGSLTLLIVGACVGTAPSGGGGGDDDQVVDGGLIDEVDAGEAVDGGADPQGLNVTGVVRDYNNLDVLAQATLTTEGLLTPLQATSGGDGSFVLANVPPGSTFYVSASVTNYQPTRQEPIAVADASVQRDVYLASQPFVQRQYTTVGVAQTAGLGFLAAELRLDDGMPLEGVAAQDIALVDAVDQPVGDGPYFFGPGGDIGPTADIDVTVAINGRARVAYLNIPPGQHTLRVPYVDGDGNAQVYEVPIRIFADSSTLGATGMSGGTAAADVTFVEDVYPILQRASAGGDACADCHRAAGSMAAFQFDLPPDVVYQEMIARPGVVELAVPAASSLLTKPAYEDPPNHPNATWLDALNASYVTVMAWIVEGAVYDSAQ